MKKLLGSPIPFILSLSFLIVFVAGCVRADVPNTGVLPEVKIVGGKKHKQISILGEVTYRYEFCLDERVGRTANELEKKAQESCPLWVESDEEQAIALADRLKKHGFDSIFSVTLKYGRIQSSKFKRPK